MWLKNQSLIVEAAPSASITLTMLQEVYGAFEFIHPSRIHDFVASLVDF